MGARNPGAVQIPGESNPSTASTQVPKSPDADDLPASRATPDVLNNAGRGTANDVGIEHERRVQALAMADAIKRGDKPDLAALAALSDPATQQTGPIKRTRVINGVEVEVEIPVVRRNEHVQTFGPESKLPKGTPVNKDGTAYEGGGQAYGVIGDINLPEGKLVSRIIPLSDEA